MVHEACGHGLEADLVQKGLSVYQNKLGQKVAADGGVSVIDDATLLSRNGSYHFDDEGCPAQRTVLIENGILKAYMNDRMTAMKQGSSPTGNGRRESYQYRPVPRMSNTYIAPPDRMTPEDIIRDTPPEVFWLNAWGGRSGQYHQWRFCFRCSGRISD